MSQRFCQNPHNGHICDLNIRLDRYTDRVTHFLKLVNPCPMDQVLDVSFVSIQLVQRISRVFILELWTIQGLGGLALMENSLGSSHCQRVAIIVNIWV
jgi:hypothetical protein